MRHSLTCFPAANDSGLQNQEGGTDQTPAPRDQPHFQTRGQAVSATGVCHAIHIPHTRLTNRPVLKASHETQNPRPSHPFRKQELVDAWTSAAQQQEAFLFSKTHTLPSQKQSR